MLMMIRINTPIMSLIFLLSAKTDVDVDDVAQDLILDSHLACKILYSFHFLSPQN
jgi:hypothetical protein